MVRFGLWSRASRRELPGVRLYARGKADAAPIRASIMREAVWAAILALMGIAALAAVLLLILLLNPAIGNARL